MTGFKIVRWALAAAGMLVSVTGASAEEGVFMKDVLGSLGIIEKERPPIDYRERAPLVLPPRMDLRTPQASSAAANPQWPNDPDVAAARRREADSRIPVTETERRRLSQNPTLSIYEMRAGRRPGAGVSDEPAPIKNDRTGVWIHPDTLRAEGRLSEGPGLGTEEPMRQSLVQPPTGYRKPTGPRMRASSEPVSRPDESDSKSYLYDQARRR